MMILKNFVKFFLILIGVLVIFGFGSYLLLTPPKMTVPHQQEHILSDVSIWNPGERLLPHQTIITKHGEIVDIRPTRHDDPEGVCRNCLIMPGLIDAHVHTPPKIAIGNQSLFALLYLKYGVTSVRDLGQFDNSIVKLQQKIKKGKLAGPNYYRCGPILDGDPPGVLGARAIKSSAEAKIAVQELVQNGVDCIKNYGDISKEAFAGMAAEAHRLGTPLTGHTPRAISLSEITNYEVQHYTGIPYLTKPAPANWAYKSEDLIAMTESEIDLVTEVMKNNSISILTTNANLMARLTVSDKDRFPPTEGLRYLPEFWEKLWPSIVSHPETEEAIQVELEAVPYGLAFIANARANGIDVLAGTDVVMPYVIPGESLHLQLAMLERAFGTSTAALEAATIVNGRHVTNGNIGVIKKGAQADLLIFKDDPRERLSNIQNWDYVMVNGRLYNRSDVEAQLERMEQHFHGVFYRTFFNVIYGFVAPKEGVSSGDRH